MASRFGWFPTRRDDIIHMADAWVEQLELHAAADSRLLTRPPAIAEDLPKHFSTGRKKYELEFGLADIGMEAHVTVCRQTPRNQDGPYCPIVSRIIA